MELRLDGGEQLAEALRLDETSTQERLDVREVIDVPTLIG
jgi:hypothetical protein